MKEIPKINEAELLAKAKESFKRSSLISHYLTLPYEYTIIPCADGNFVASVKELPGCITQGESWDDTLDMIQDAMECWMSATLDEGRTIPLPKAMIPESPPRKRKQLRRIK